MATVTYGSSSSTWIRSLTDSGSISTAFTPNFTGNTDPTSGYDLFAVKAIEVNVRYTDTDGNESFKVFLGSGSHGDTSKFLSTSNTAGASFSTYNISVPQSYSSTNQPVIRNDVTYYAGVQSTSASGITSTRNNAISGNETRTIFTGGGTTYSNEAIYLKLTYYGLPNQVSGVTATTNDSTSITISWTATGTRSADSGITEAAVSQYRIQSSTSSSFTSPTTAIATTNSYTFTGLTAGTTYYFRVAAQNKIKDLNFPNASGPWSASANATTSTGTVTPPTAAPTFSGSFGDGTVGVPYDDQVTVSDATSITTGSGNSRPPGLSVDTDNSSYYRLYGTPTQSGTYSIVLSATGPGGTTNDPADSITISAAPTATNPSWNSGSYATAYVSVAYSSQVTASNASSYAVTSGSLPPGLSLDSGNGKISGTPTQTAVASAVQSYTFTITAYGVSGTTPASKQFTISMALPINRVTATNGTNINSTIGQRWNGTSWTPIQTMKRWNGTSWVDLIP